MEDVMVTPAGSVVRFRLCSPAAHEWVRENVQLESWQWLGVAVFAVDWRYASPIMRGMLDAGLLVV